MMLHDTVGWIACVFALVGATLATSYTRRLMFWGWCCFFIGNTCWVLYGITTATMPLIVYNAIRAIFSLRGAYNNTRRRKQAIRAQREKDSCSNTAKK